MLQVKKGDRIRYKMPSDEGTGVVTDPDYQGGYAREQGWTIQLTNIQNGKGILALSSRKKLWRS